MAASTSSNATLLEPLTALEGPPPSTAPPRSDASTRRLQTMAKLRKRQTAALRVLRRSGLLLFLNVAAVLAQMDTVFWLNSVLCVV